MATRRKTLGADTQASDATVLTPDGAPIDPTTIDTPPQPEPDQMLAATPDATGCVDAGNCAQAGRAPWRFHTDKTGERTTATEADGSFWNRACPADTCAVRVYL